MEEAARLFLGLLVLALILNLIYGGRGGVRDWVRAKFLGKPPARPLRARGLGRPAEERG